METFVNHYRGLKHMLLFAFAVFHGQSELSVNPGRSAGTAVERRSVNRYAPVLVDLRYNEGYNLRTRPCAQNHVHHEHCGKV